MPRYYEDEINRLVDELQTTLDRILVVGIDRKTSQQAYELATKHELIYATAGIHPHNAKSFSTNQLSWYEQLLREKEVLAVGEIGLDYYHENSPRKKQQTVARGFLSLAEKLKLPVILHVRPKQNNPGIEIFNQIFSLLEQNCGDDLKGIFHCFSGNQEILNASRKFGFYYSLAGNITYKNNKKIRQTIKQIPPDKILAETDSPYLTPQTQRGNKNRPDYILNIYQTLAEIYEMNLDELIEQVRTNSNKLLNWF